MQGARWAGWITGCTMAVLGAFWMFAWLIGSNGYNSSRGATVLGGNLLLVALALVGSVWLARRLSGRWLANGWPLWRATALATVSSVAAALVFLGVGCLVVVGIA